MYLIIFLPMKQGKQLLIFVLLWFIILKLLTYVRSPCSLYISVHLTLFFHCWFNRFTKFTISFTRYWQWLVYTWYNNTWMDIQWSCLSWNFRSTCGRLLVALYCLFQHILYFFTYISSTILSLFDLIVLWFIYRNVFIFFIFYSCFQNYFSYILACN